MLIQALNDYYSVLESKGKLKEEGYASCDIGYLIRLTEDGKFTGFVDNHREEHIKKKDKVTTIFVPKPMDLPERARSTTVRSNFVENRPGYIFGLEYRAKSEGQPEYLSPESKGSSDKTKAKLRLQHESFVQEVERDFGDIDSPIARAYVNFAKTWNPIDEVQNEYLLNLKADLNKTKFAFCLDGHPEILLHADPMVRQKWSELRDQPEEETGGIICQCAVTGEMLPVAEVHDTMASGKGIGIANAGINPSLVNFKPESFLSYGHQQGENACISAKAMKRYTKAMNWLLASPKNHSYIDNLTVFFWSSDGNTSNDQMAMDMLLNPQSSDFSELYDSGVRSLMRAAERGAVTDKNLENMSEGLTPNAQFFIVGAEPNASRIQIKFIYRQQFGRLLKNIARHQRDMKIRENMRPVSLARIKKELISQKITNPEKRVLAPFNSLFQTIIEGTEYPFWCLNTVMTRIRTDFNTDENQYIRINDVRAGLVKACLIRHTKEEISMALDYNNTNQAYLCGRLFACLEKIQQDAAGAKLNRTIGDAYFSSAMTKPAAVFPNLLSLSKHHLAKIRKTHEDWATVDSKWQLEIIGKLVAEFPKTLDIYDQGRFVIGYYQQREEFYKKKDTAERNNTIEDAETEINK
ncbi:MAG: type I-C CRISPR-associated protein Cas8c/Csd1 [Bilifractor sp.]|jgi:CRISPR-associated protein Csd1